MKTFIWYLFSKPKIKKAFKYIITTEWCYDEYAISESSLLYDFVIAFDHDCNMNYIITRKITPQKGVLLGILTRPPSFALLKCADECDRLFHCQHKL